MAVKDKDLFLDMLENPNLTLEDMVSVGHSAESSRFLEKSAYENSQRVRNKFTDSEGNFKQDEFDKWYNLAANAYQQITDKDINMSLVNVTSFGESDITVSPDKRTLNTKPIVSFTPNPDRLTTSIYRIGKIGERERTQSELAQAEKILLNPVEAASDPSKARWGDAPNDSWWGNFFDTQVLAQWDEDGEHIDPVTKQKVSHKKGELKLNDNGTYYYEALDGRDIYGRQVLNKMNTITTDGTFWNQYDFFDSDDIKEKSFVGSTAKNLALVGSMFIPYVGWGVALASVGTQVVGLTGTLGKMLTGSDSPTFSAMEGWAQSFDRQGAKSEYAQQNMLCWENFINLIGDSVGQLREQRAIFKFVPAILGKGKYGIQSKNFGMNSEALKESIATTERTALNKSLDQAKTISAAMKGSNSIEMAAARANSTIENVVSSIADAEVKKYLEDYNNLGELIARAYMVGITVGDTYGEAKEAGASDFEATMLTLGYAAAENALLNSDLGKWIFPELKADRATKTQIARKVLESSKDLTEEGIASSLKSSGVKKLKADLIGKRIAEMPQDVREASSILGKLANSERASWLKKWFTAGREVFDTQKSIMKGTLQASIANALAEGTEEVSEELLKDFSNSCFNLVKAAQGNNDVRLQGFLGNWDWNEAFKRYGMSFFGGAIGGGINSASFDYSQFKNISNMTTDQAMQQLVWMDRNGEIEEFFETVNKESLGNKYLSTHQNEDGSFKLGTNTDNQDLEAKRALRAQVNMIHNILKANGANIDDDGLIGQIMKALPAEKSEKILGDFRTSALATSVTAGRFLKEFNNISKAIVLESLRLNNLQNSAGDSKANISENLQRDIEESKETLRILNEAKNKLLNGERTVEFYQDALFETTYGVSEFFITPTEIQYAELMAGKPYALIDPQEKENLKNKYASWSKTERAEQIHQLATIFFNVERKTSDALQKSTDLYRELLSGQRERLQQINNLSIAKLNVLKNIIANESGDKLSKIQDVILNFVMNTKDRKADPLGLVVNQQGEIQPDVESVIISDVQDTLANDNNVYLNKLQDIINDTSLDNDSKAIEMTRVYVDNMYLEIQKTAEEIIDSGYAHPEVKYNMQQILKQTKDFLDFYSLELENRAEDLNLDNKVDQAENMLKASLELSEKSKEIKFLLDSINQLAYTPIAENLRSFAIGIGTSDSVLSLIEQAIANENVYQEQIENLMLDDSLVQQYQEAKKVLELYRTAIVAARHDNADFDHIFGFNAALNELCGQTEGWKHLAEIDGDTAKLALQDINMAINRLEINQEISSLNQGNKLAVQQDTAINKNYILYNKTSKLITSLLNEDDDDAKKFREKWAGFDDLVTTVNNLSLHKELTAKELKDRKFKLNTKQVSQLEKEQHVLADALYDFFQKNKDKFANTQEAIKDLELFIKASKLDLYDKSDQLLNQATEDISDTAFIWWLASKAALKGSDFYKIYRKVLSQDIAPIPTQELGIYAGIAAITNGDIFTAFGRAMKQHLYDDWKSKSDAVKENGKFVGEKADIISNKGLLGVLPLTNEDIDEVLNSDLTPNFTNILFIEGIPGGGKKFIF